MTTWITMFTIVLIFPLIMLVLGLRFNKKPPKTINYLLGYRTNMSMKNDQTWAFAHKRLGKIWSVVGAVMLPINIIPMLLILGKAVDLIGNVAATVCLVNAAVIAATIIPVEIALKKNFNKDGTPK